MIIKGYINIQRLEQPNGKVSFCTGSDIHPEEESAKRCASKNTVGQVYVAFEYEPEIKRTRDMRGYHAEKQMEDERLSERIGEKVKRKYQRKTKEQVQED